MGTERERLEGRIFSSNNYGDFEVLDYLGRSWYNIKFTNTGTIIKTKRTSILSGKVKDRLYLSVINKGYHGDKYNSTHFLYGRWRSMILRCYDENNLLYKFYGAKGITVCDRWYNFSNYVDDVVLLEGYDEKLAKTRNLHLDKDMINREALIYSPETCKWLTNLENTEEMFKRTKQKKFIAIRILDGYIEEPYSVLSFSKKYNIPHSSIHRCLEGAIFQTKGWVFKYKYNPKEYKHRLIISNKSGFTGVSFIKDVNLWYASCRKNNKTLSLGQFVELKDAIIARYNWEVETYGIYRSPDSKDEYLKEIGYI